jgi:hypothetical protein
MLRLLPNAGQHSWKFFRTGGLDQVALETAEDLRELPKLDQKLWVALSCPVKGIEIDPRTLELVDTDRDGFVRVPEVLAAVEWAIARLKQPAQLLKGHPSLPLSEINVDVPANAVLVTSAREILKRLGKAGAEALFPEDFSRLEKIFPATALNGDGILAPAESDDPEVQILIREIIATVGGEKDRSGSEGITEAKQKAFFDQLSAYLDWIAKSADKEIAVLGEKTAAACSAVAAVRGKIDDYFARCRLAAFDARAIAALNRQESEFLAIAAKDLKLTSEEIAGFPLARVTAEGVLPLFEGSNPAWSAALTTLYRDAIVPMFGADQRTLSADEWTALTRRLAPYETWLGKKVGGNIELLGVDRARQLQSGEARTKLEGLFAADRQLQPHFEAIASVERLVRYYRDLGTLLQNFVNFADFYARDRWAIFQAGKLFLDSRACELCIRVDDPAAHAALATMSKAYIAYVDCRRGKELIKVAACFTQGDSDYLFVGRNGVFYDRTGRDWQATITKIIDNPISLREAFWSPYKKVLRAVEEQVAKRAAAAESTNVSHLTTAALPAAGSPSAPPPPPPAARPNQPTRKLDLSSIIGLGVALGSIGTFLATVFAKFVELPGWQIPLVILALMFTISLPSVVIAWLKLRQRNLGPILEANGWAINGRVKINVPFGTALTERAKIPRGARRALKDPYADKDASRRRALLGILAVVIVLALVAWNLRHRGYWTRLTETLSSPVPSTAPKAH